MRLPLIMLALSFAAPAWAEDCGVWKAEMMEDEGGPVMTAAACTRTGDKVSDLLVTCADDMLVFRYLAIVPDPFPPNDDMEYRTRIDLDIDGKSHSVDAVFEAMDGALALYPKRSDPLISALKDGKSLTIRADAAGIAPVTLSLKNADQALEKVEKSCGN
ncbi:MAG: hypothetical protein RLZZ444_2398 [Pseudomonadota bacterium]|jgi:hypothetical protein